MYPYGSGELLARLFDQERADLEELAIALGGGNRERWENPDVYAEMQARGMRPPD